MSLDLSRLIKPKKRGGKIIAQCPACEEQGADTSGEHLVIFEGGAYACVAHAGDKAHQKKIHELAGGASARSSLPIRSTAAPVRRGSPELPKFDQPTISELSALARQRGLPSYAGLEIAYRAGHLYTAPMRDGSEMVRAWLIIDSARQNAQARRMDGRPWVSINAKAKTLPGSAANWPIGAADIGAKSTVALCEGGGDFLAAYFLMWWHGRTREVAPVAMLGAGQRIHAEALPLFAGKHVRIFPHQDDSGMKARGVWTQQLQAAGAASVSAFNCSGDKDLNDMVARCWAAAEATAA